MGPGNLSERYVYIKVRLGTPSRDLGYDQAIIADNKLTLPWHPHMEQRAKHQGFNSSHLASLLLASKRVRYIVPQYITVLMLRTRRKISLTYGTK